MEFYGMHILKETKKHYRGQLHWTSLQNKKKITTLFAYQTGHQVSQLINYNITPVISIIVHSIRSDNTIDSSGILKIQRGCLFGVV